MKLLQLLALSVAILFSGAVTAKLPPATKYIPKVDFGVKAGANFDNMKGNGWSKTYQAGYHGGLFLGFREQVFGVQGEALVSGGQYSLSPSGANVKNVYLQIPAMFELKLVPRVWLQAGPQYSLLFSSKFETNGNATNYFKTGGFSGVAGLQILLPLHITIGARYLFGLSNWNENSKTNTWIPRSTQLYVGLKFI